MTSGLHDIVKDDGSLNSDLDKKALFMSYATIYDNDLEENLELTSIELANKYETGNPTSWRKFLNHPSVKRYISGFLHERAETSAFKALGGDTPKQADALRIMQMVDSKKEKVDNSKFIVVHLPQKDYI